MKSRVEALRWARFDRLCPPANLCTLPEHSEQCERHRQICPICSVMTGEDDAPFRKLVSSLREWTEAQTEHQEKSVPVQPGQVWQIRPELARWQGFNYYSSPPVFVLGDAKDGPEAVRVVQIYTDPVLAAPGDLILEEDRTGGLAPFFIEAWNVYSLPREDLGQLLTQLDEEVSEAVLRLVENPEDYPRWALFPRPIRGPNDTRVFFRRMEAEVGRTFSSSAAVSLPTDMEEGNVLTLDYASADDLLNDLSLFSIKMPQMEEINVAPADILFMVEPVLLAAAPADEETDAEGRGTLTAVAFTVKAARIADSFPVATKITDRLWDGLHMEFTGELIDRNRLDPDLRWIWVFRWLYGDGILLEPVREATGEEQGTFWVTFDLPNMEVARKGKLCIRIFGEVK